MKEFLGAAMQYATIEQSPAFAGFQFRRSAYKDKFGYAPDFCFVSRKAWGEIVNELSHYFKNKQDRKRFRRAMGGYRKIGPCRFVIKEGFDVPMFGHRLRKKKIPKPVVEELIMPGSCEAVPEPLDKKVLPKKGRVSGFKRLIYRYLPV